MSEPAGQPATGAQTGSPGDTDVYVPPAGASSAGGSGDGMDPSGTRGADKAGTSFDTIVGRLVIEQGLATRDEVRHCSEIARNVEDASSKSLAELLVHNSYITERQLARLRQDVEAERSGQQIPGYKVLGKLGAGAMAKVYKAKQVKLDRAVAIKILPDKFASNPQFIQRFFDEGRAAAQLNHPNIVQAIEIGNVGDLYYFVMEYVDGRTVHDDITANKRFAEADAIEVVIQVAEALHHAHERGLVHRDVKPKNIMISKQGIVKLADMGLARAMSDKEAAEAEAGKAFGTPYYISPEQIRGERDIGPQADIYSLGATLYHMLTGNVPFEGKNPSAVMSKHLKAELVAPDHVNPKLSAGISEVCEMMMAKSPRDRYRSCQDLLVDLRAVRDGQTPPMAHQEIVAHEGLVDDLVSAESSAPSEIPVDQTNLRGKSILDVLREPAVIVLLLVSLGSLGLNLALLMGR